jgi:hypothetical protein
VEDVYKIIIRCTSCLAGTQNPIEEIRIPSKTLQVRKGNMSVQ